MPERRGGETTGQDESLARLRALVEEQAALRRVATLVASGAEPLEVFACVCAEIGGVLEVGGTNLTRFDAEGTQTVVGAWSVAGTPVFPVGGELPFSDNSVTWKVFRTGCPARIDDFTGLEGELPERLRAFGILSGIAAPITVNGSLWGAVVASSGEPNSFPAGTEQRIADFAELVSDALASADAREQLAASRARIVEAADAERRRLERNLHDGAQQRLVSLLLDLQLLRKKVPDRATAQMVDATVAKLAEGLTELRELARGIHPAMLTDRGLVPALEALADRSAVSVDLDLKVPTRLPIAVETAAYYVAAEALTNVAKYSRATYAHVAAEDRDGVLALEIADNGIGGADLAKGTGLRGLSDRIAAIDGKLTVASPLGGGTRVSLAIPHDEVGRSGAAYPSAGS